MTLPACMEHKTLFININLKGFSFKSRIFIKDEKIDLLYSQKKLQIVLWQKLSEKVDSRAKKHPKVGL